MKRLVNTPGRVVCALSALLALAACGGGGSPHSPATQGDAGPSAGSPPATTAPGGSESPAGNPSGSTIQGVAIPSKVSVVSLINAD